MPPRRAATEDEEDRLSALPDALLDHVLSFLPTEDAVRTCVLARWWRHLWKSVTALRIGCADEREPVSVDGLRRFVDPLFSHRGGFPLQTSEFRIGNFSGFDSVDRVNFWLRRTVACNVQSLELFIHDNNYVDPWLLLDDLPLVSQHLKRLKLRGVCCHNSFLNFSSCPALEYLEFYYCDVSSAKKISSRSLKVLIITYSVFAEDFRLRIDVPNLISLRLDDLWYTTPVLESMPALAEAFVTITEQCDDYCKKLLNGNLYCDCECCDNSEGISNGGHGCVVLKGLSEAKNLVLISEPLLFIFKSDLRWCPTFSKLKTLWLNDYWCCPDLCPLACILEHSPVLEKLTLQLFSEGPEYDIEMKGTFVGMAEQPAAISEHLQIVEVKCSGIDKRILRVLKFLCTFNICFSF